jgi:hypothetical protein
MGVTCVLQASARRPVLTKLVTYVLVATRRKYSVWYYATLQTLALRVSTLGTAEMVEDAPALYHNTSIEVQY